MEPFEKTYAMIKPDAVAAGKAEEICQLIEVHGFTIVSRQKLQVQIVCEGPSGAVALYHTSVFPYALDICGSFAGAFKEVRTPYYKPQRVLAAAAHTTKG